MSIRALANYKQTKKPAWINRSEWMRAVYITVLQSHHNTQNDCVLISRIENVASYNSLMLRSAWLWYISASRFFYIWWSLCSQFKWFNAPEVIVKVRYPTLDQESNVWFHWWRRFWLPFFSLIFFSMKI